MIILALLIIHWYASLFLQSFFHHRYAAHRLFTMSKFWERFFYIACFIVHGSSYLSPSAYAVMHRLHHEHTDTGEDPHSPHNAPNILAMLLQGRNFYFDVFMGKVIINEKYTKHIPSWRLFDKIAHNWITRFCWVLIYIAVYFLFAKSYWLFLLLPVTILMGTMQGAIVNWWAHLAGYENFEMKNTSKNILRVDVLFCGEAYHNNHHKYPGRLNNAYKWFEFDITYHIARLFHTCRIINMNPVKSQSPLTNF